jgi:hypothetical protein
MYIKQSEWNSIYDSPLKKPQIEGLLLASGLLIITVNLNTRQVGSVCESNSSISIGKAPG